MVVIIFVTPAQCRAARALLNWTQHQLSEKAMVARKTVADFEANSRRLHRRTIADITSAFLNAGISLVATDQAEGVTIRKG